MMAVCEPSWVSLLPRSASSHSPISRHLPRRPRHCPMLKKTIAVASLLMTLAACGPKHIDQAPRSPQESLRSIQVQPGFKVELFASEPLVFDPVEMVFDENGRMFVAEML